jgi:TM2 domain-containing membrane protein YozV
MGAADTGSGMEVKGYCRHCGKALTAETWREVGGAFYCPDCLAAMVDQAKPPERSAGGRAATAAALGIVPGLGAVYNGEFVKAAIHILIFGTIISLINRSAFFVVLLVAWIFYMPLEAYQTAKAKTLAGPQAKSWGAPARREQLGPIVLISIGTLALLDRLNIVNIDRVLDFWPLGLIALGVWLLVKRQQE